MVIEGEIAHETEGALRKRDHGWHFASVELLGCPENRTITAKCNYIIDLVFVLRAKYGVFCLFELGLWRARLLFFSLSV